MLVVASFTFNINILACIYVVAPPLNILVFWIAPLYFSPPLFNVSLKIFALLKYPFNLPFILAPIGILCSASIIAVIA